MTEETPLFGIVTSDQHTEQIASNIKEVQSRGAPVVAITDAPDTVESVSDAVLQIPGGRSVAAPILANVQLQFVSYWIANDLGRSIDKPRNLAKSVTVK